MAQIADLNDNIPLPFEQTTMWTNADVMWIHHGKTDISKKDLALDVSSVGYYRYYIGPFMEKFQHKIAVVTVYLQSVIFKFRGGVCLGGGGGVGLEERKISPNTCKVGNGLVLLISVGMSIWPKWVNDLKC